MDPGTEPPPGTQTLGNPSSQPSPKHTQTFSHPLPLTELQTQRNSSKDLKHTHCPGQEGLRVAGLRVGWSTGKQGWGRANSRGVGFKQPFCPPQQEKTPASTSWQGQNLPGGISGLPEELECPGRELRPHTG